MKHLRAGEEGKALSAQITGRESLSAQITGRESHFAQTVFRSLE